VRLRLLVCLAIGLAGCAQPAPSVREGSIRYVALGDSYTIGTSVAAADSWPSQLVARIPQLALVANLGVNGYTSGRLIASELPLLDELAPDFVTLQIGVNDVVQRFPEDAYVRNVEEILDDLLSRLDPDRVLCVATPDYTVTPQGSAFGSPEEQRAGIERVNTILETACAARGARFAADIFAISQGATESSMLALDGLHPSGAQYALWVDAIQPVVEVLLGG
jgi:lysophospholipase L1-like esterase